MSTMRHASSISTGGETIVLKMNSIKIGDFIKQVKKIVAKKMKWDEDKIKEKIIGRRQGEKIHEELLTEEELEWIYEEKDFLIVNKHKSTKISSNIDPKWIYSKNSERLSSKEIKKMILECLEKMEKK